MGLQKWLLILILFILPVAALGQGSAYTSNVFTSANNVPPGAQAPIYTAPNATITVCAYPAVPTGSVCTNTASIFADVGLTVPMANPLRADGQGRFAFFIASGTYAYSVVTAAGSFAGVYAFSVGGAGGGGAGTVTTFAAPTGSWPTWLVPTVTNPTTTPSLAVAASAIPNTALANSATTVNGQSCVLGSTCTITTGSSAFSALTAGTNTTAAMVVGSGASLAASGSGTIAATSAPFSGLTGTATASQLPGSDVTTINTIPCTIGTSCTVTLAPPAAITYSPAAVCDGGTASASGLTRYDNQQPQAGCLVPASSTAAYLAFNAAASSPQYASATIATPTYWTGTSLYLKFAGTATTGNVGWIVDTACTNDGQVLSSASFGTATTITTTVSATLGANVTTAIYSNVGVPGTNGCAAGTTIPGSLLTYRVHRSASDTQTGNANLLGVVLVVGRSQ